MTLTPEQKDHAKGLIASGKKLEAVTYLREILRIDLKQAHALTEKLEEQRGGSLRAFTPSNPLRFVDSESRIVAGVFMCLGLILLAGAAYLIYSHRQFEQDAIRVNGTVVEYRSHIDQDEDGSTTMYTPVFAYTFGGKTHTHVSNISSSSYDYEIGEQVDILVNPKDPTAILVDRFQEKWLLPMILGVIGMSFVGAGYLTYRIFGR